MFKKLFIAIAMLLATGSVAVAACDQAAIQAKSQEMMTLVAAKTQADPAKANEISAEMQKLMGEMQNAKDPEEVCKHFDAMIEKLKN